MKIDDDGRHYFTTDEIAIETARIRREYKRFRRRKAGLYAAAAFVSGTNAALFIFLGMDPVVMGAIESAFGFLGLASATIYNVLVISMIIYAIAFSYSAGYHFLTRFPGDDEEWVMEAVRSLDYRSRIGDY